ncbi:hypothetical protein CRENBAI_016573 [Crenichthys baileyi]|uniref:Uncharacterized protein n=1 Tax=Crenichthys baileyi TaxID=28760 RepID=A0AAV9RLN0_9TELE
MEECFGVSDWADLDIMPDQNHTSPAYTSSRRRRPRCKRSTPAAAAPAKPNLPTASSPEPSTSAAVPAEPPTSSVAHAKPSSPPAVAEPSTPAAIVELCTPAAVIKLSVLEAARAEFPTFTVAVATYRASGTAPLFFLEQAREERRRCTVLNDLLSHLMDLPSLWKQKLKVLDQLKSWSQFSSLPLRSSCPTPPLLPSRRVGSTPFSGSSFDASASAEGRLLSQASTALHDVTASTVFGAQFDAKLQEPQPAAQLQEPQHTARPLDSQHAARPLDSQHAAKSLDSQHAARPLDSQHATRPLDSQLAAKPRDSQHAAKPQDSAKSPEPQHAAKLTELESAAAGSTEPQPVAAGPTEPHHDTEEPEGGLPPRPGPEHLLSFLWGVLLELRTHYSLTL